YSTYSSPHIGSINLAMLNKELIGHACGHLFLLLSPAIRYIVERIRSRRSSTGSMSASTGQILCAKCDQYAIQPVKARDTNNVIKDLCYYCYCVGGDSRLTLIKCNTSSNTLSNHERVQ